jgi:hypothetical protein
MRTSVLESEVDELDLNRIRESLIGTACGFVLGAALAFTNGFSSSPLQLLLIAVGIVVSSWALRPWIRTGKLDLIALLIAIVALLLDLTAAGGINYPSVSESLWLLAAIGVGSANGRASLPAQHSSLRHRVTRSALIVACAVLFVAAYVTSYLPVTSCRASLARADMAILSGTPNQHPAAVDAASAAQIASQRVVASRLAEYQDRPSSERLASVIQSVDQMLDLSPRKFSAWQYASEVAETLFRLTKDPQHIDSAIEYQQQAIERFPTSPQLHFQLARLMLTADNPSGAAAAAQEAMRLDAFMRSAGHTDRQFGESELEMLRAIMGGQGAFDAEKPPPVQ